MHLLFQRRYVGSSQLAVSSMRSFVSELGVGRWLQREMPEVRSFQLFQVTGS